MEICLFCCNRFISISEPFFLSAPICDINRANYSVNTFDFRCVIAVFYEVWNFTQSTKSEIDQEVYYVINRMPAHKLPMNVSKIIEWNQRYYINGTDFYWSFNTGTWMNSECVTCILKNHLGVSSKVHTCCILYVQKKMTVDFVRWFIVVFLFSAWIWVLLLDVIETHVFLLVFAIWSKSTICGNNNAKLAYKILLMLTKHERILKYVWSNNNQIHKLLCAVFPEYGRKQWWNNHSISSYRARWLSFLGQAAT